MNEIIKTWVSLGFSVIPTDKKKKPVVAWKDYQTRKPNETELSKWFLNGNNPAVVCGAISGGLVILDCDDPHISDLLGIDTLIVKTPSGGKHIYVKSEAIPDKMQAYRGYALDIQADKSYALLPGSKTDKGEYVIIRDAPIKEFDNILEYLDQKLPLITDAKERDIQKFKESVGTSVIERWVKIENEGHNYKQGKCPFHGDDDPSFTIYDKGYYCFGCGEHGDVIDFVMKKEGLDFNTALIRLSEITGIKAPAPKPNKAREKDDKTRTLAKSTMRVNGRLYEQVSTRDGYKFAYLDNGIIKYKDEINQEDGITYNPCMDEEVIKRAVLFCTEAGDYGSIQDLIKRIDAFILKWLDIPDLDRMFYAYYILQTWVYEKFHTIGYARAMGDTGTGKTRFLDAIGGLCYKPIFTNGAIGAAPIFRIMDKHHGTLVIDEANFGKTDETQAIMTILNSGWEQGKPVMRCDKEHPEKINIFDSFGAKVLGTRKRFTDSALEARCYTVTLTQTDREDIPANLDDTFFKERTEITNRLLGFRLRNIDKVKPDPEMQKLFAGIEPRVIQKALPLASIVKDDPAALKDFIQYIRDSQADLIDDRQASREGEVALAILDLYESRLGTGEKLDNILISAEDIAERLNEDLPEGKKTNSKRVGKMLKVLGFDRVQKRIKTTLATNGKKDKIVRALATNSKLIAKILRRYTITDDETYPLLRGVVASVASHNREGDNNKIIGNPVTQTPTNTEGRESAYRLATLATHDTKNDQIPAQFDRMKNLSDLITATRDSPTPDEVLISWHAQACGIDEDLARSDIEHYKRDYKISSFSMGQKSLTDTKPPGKQHLSYLCTHGQCKDCGGFECSCDCHKVAADKG